MDLASSLSLTAKKEIQLKHANLFVKRELLDEKHTY